MSGAPPWERSGRVKRDGDALDALGWTKVEEPSHAGFEMEEAVSTN